MTSPHIPRRIIQTAKSRHLSLRDRATSNGVKLLNPDFEYLFFDDAQIATFLEEEVPEYREAFSRFRFTIQRIDFFRYLAVYRYGGFYLDLDILLAEGLSSLTDLGCVFPFECLTYSSHLQQRFGMDWEIGNYAFGAAPGHPFLQAVIQNCLRAQKDPTWVSPMMKGMPLLARSEFLVLNTTGPGLLSRTLAENPSLAASVTVLFPDDVLDRGNWNRFGNIGLHLMDGTWRPRHSYLYRRLLGYLEARRLDTILRQSRQLGAARCHAGNRRGVQSSP
jgi:hypothetical protein